MRGLSCETKRSIGAAASAAHCTNRQNQAAMAASDDKACTRGLIQEDGNDGLAGEAQGRSKSQRASVDSLAGQKARTARS